VVTRGLEPLCVETMKQRSPDRSWVAADRLETLRFRRVIPVSLEELPWQNGELVVVAGVLHVEFECIALYRSPGAIDEERARLTEPLPSPWVGLTPGAFLWRNHHHIGESRRQAVRSDDTRWD
jgi:hypothetical protein